CHWAAHGVEEWAMIITWHAIGRSRLGRLFILACSTALVLTRTALTASQAAERVDLNRDVRRILSENCFKCHGPDANERKGGKKVQGLRLDMPEGAQADLG